MFGGGIVVIFVFDCLEDVVKQWVFEVFDKMWLIDIFNNFGDVKLFVIYFVIMMYWVMGLEGWVVIGFGDGVVCILVGLEDIDDLIVDIDWVLS